MRHLRHLPAREGKEGRLTAARAGFAIALAALAALLLEIPFCPVAALTGFPCPSCGLLRATLALFQGDAASALSLHPLVFVVLPAVACGAFVVTRPEGVPPRLERAIRPLAWTLLLALSGVWVARFAGALGGPVSVTRAPWLRHSGHETKGP